MRNVSDYYPKDGRVILHVDMNAFYCSVHAAEEPEVYKGRPTAVAGSSELRRGIIVTCSYEARKYGVATGMVVREALRLCPQLTLIRPNFQLYRQYSKAFMNIAYSYTPVLEATSIDECYLDISGSSQFGTPVEIAEAMQQRIQDELGLPCSIGIAPNKLLAKMGSDMKKPNGITILRLRDVPNVLWPLPCSQLFGIGRKTADKLLRMNIRTIGELAAAEEKLLIEHFGVNGSWMKLASNGISHSPVNPVREPNKSIGHATTLPLDVNKPEDIRRILLNISDQVARRLRRQGMLAGGVQLTMRTPEMKTYTRSHMLETHTEDAEQIYKEACRLYQQHWNSDKPVRLLGITLQQLIPKDEAAVQLDLFSYDKAPKKENLIKVMDTLRDKFGESAVLTAGMLGDDPSVLLRNPKLRGTSLQKDNLETPG